MKINGEIVCMASQSTTQRDVAREPRDAAHARCNDDLVDVGAAGDDWRGGRFDEVSDVSVWKPLAQRVNGGCREYYVPDLPKTDEENLQGSTVASSISITGMSSLIG